MKITIVIVLYKQKIEACKTILSLTNALASQDKLNQEMNIILYDNSPDEKAFSSNAYPGLSISYIHDPRNLGIVTAYNYALAQAKKNDSSWLLLLDHDTEITTDYIGELYELDDFEADVAAVVPVIHYQDTVISPVMSNTLRPLKSEKPSIGLQSTPIMAINSGSLIRVSFLEEIGGFNQRFPLDYLDHWLFYEVYAKGYRVFVLDTALEHELSVMDYSRVSLNRYKSILESEVLFYKQYKKDLLPEYKVQLLKRLIKQILLVKNKKIAITTLRRLSTLILDK